MGDYGIRVSKTGKDVLTDEDFDMALTSKYPTWKIHSTVSGTFTLNAGNFRLTLTGTHNIGYKPIWFGYIKYGSKTFLVQGIFNSGETVATSSGTSSLIFSAFHFDTNKVKLRVETDDSAGVDNDTSFTFYFVIMYDEL